MLVEQHGGRLLGARDASRVNARSPRGEGRAAMTAHTDPQNGLTGKNRR
jgi:hypothetical protein